MYLHLFTLKIFCTVVEKGSISKAAEELFLTQPAVSLQIKALEDFYNTKLFNRTPRGLRINQQGEILYRHTKKLNHIYNKMNEEMSKQVSKEIRGSLHIGAGTVAGTCFIPKILGAFKKAYPKIEIYLEVLKTPQIVRDLLDENLDIAMVCRAPKKGGLQYEKILLQRLCLVGAKGQPKAEGGKISLLELKGKRLILKEGTCEIRIMWQKFLERHKVNLGDFDIISVSSSISAIKSAAKEGMGLAVLPVCMIKDELESGKLQKIDIKEGDLDLPFYLAFKPTGLQKINIYNFYRFMKAFSPTLAVFLLTSLSL